MKGNNELILNTATMIEAVQEWLDRRMPEHAPQVNHVTSKPDGSGMFTVSLMERETPNG